MKEKILAAIKAKFPKVNLSKKRLDAIAAKIEAKVIDDETKIDASIDEFNDFNPLADLAKQDDKIRDLESKLKPPATPPKKDDPPPVDEPDDDTPKWAKALIESNKAITEKMQQMEGEKQQTTIKGKIAATLKDIPASYWNKRSLPAKDEEIEAFIEDVKTDYTAFQQELTNKDLGNIPLPGGGNTPSKTAAVSPELKAYAAKHAVAENGKAVTK